MSGHHMTTVGSKIMHRNPKILGHQPPILGHFDLKLLETAKEEGASMLRHVRCENKNFKRSSIATKELIEQLLEYSDLTCSN